MAGWLRASDVEWYELYDCSICGAKALLEGIVVRRTLVLLIVPVPLWRDWYIRCQKCGHTWKVSKNEWKQRERKAFTRQQMAEESAAAITDKRTSLPAPLLARVEQLERNGWKFLTDIELPKIDDPAPTDETDACVLEFWRNRRGSRVERLRILVDSNGELLREYKWVGER